MRIKVSTNISGLQRKLRQVVDGRRKMDYKAVGEYLVERLKNHIDMQDLDWKPLSPVTIARKGHDRAWVDTNELYDNITYRIIRDGKAVKVQVGVFDHPTRTFVAWVLEYGYDGEKGGHPIPERPLFRTTINMEKDEVERIVWEMSRENIRESVRS